MVTTEGLTEYNNNKKMVQDRFLAKICKSKTISKIYLRNGICLQGQVKYFDHEIIMMLDKDMSIQMIYKNSVATILTLRCGI